VVEAVRRLFVAMPVDDDTRHAMAALLAERVPRGLPGRVVAPENWHVTLRFVGWADDRTQDLITAALDGADLGARFRVGWGGLGAFPGPRRARVLWVGIDEGAAKAVALAGRVEEALETAGLPPADRPFHPHLTVSRLRPTQDVTPIVESVAPLGVTTAVDRVTLFESHLGRGGARYEMVEEFPLT
jgi:RNA 2',3'-cyclic 3'-phosphodiesterase